MEKTRLSQQHQIQSLQTQVDGLETTVQALGQYLSQLTDRNHSIDMPVDIRRIVQYICSVNDNNSQLNRKKPIFVERKIGKSMSVNGQLGLPLKVLEELNESVDSPKHTNKSICGTSVPPTESKTPFFENTYHQIRQQNLLRPNRFEDTQNSTQNIDIKLPDHVERVLEHLTISPKESDSGIATPLSPRTCGIAQEIIEPSSVLYSGDMHPLSSCEDVNFKFNGTTQLKSFRSQHFHNSSRTVSSNNVTAANPLTTNGTSSDNQHVVQHMDSKMMGRS